MVDERLVGVAAAFATHPLDGLDLGSFAAAAGDIARCIDRKRVAEALQESEVQMRQLQKMEAVGQLAGGIAHDFNNLLTVILGRSAILLHSLAPDHPSRKHLQNIEDTAQRATLLTRQLLAFSRKQVLAPAVLDLNVIVLGMKDILHQLIGANVELAFLCNSDVGRVKVDRGQTEQVLVNLVVNARDAMPDGGRITIQTADVVLDERDAGRLPGVTPGRYVMLAVVDTGTGMDAATLARIFEPFFTTKEPGKGTGLGLATVYGIIRQSGGGIAVESTPGEGTTFRIYLPCVDAATATVAAPSAPAARGTETVLLVEDDGDVRALIETVLAGQGYAVLAAGRPREAVQIAERHPGPIHLLFTDMVMPEMNGTELARQLVALRPEIAVLYVSGYTHYAADGPVEPHGRGGRAAFLQKPFTPDTLARAVRAVLDGATPAAVSTLPDHPMLR
jgi:signal transduction histidine kinase/CheY-like chemotaxis protein